MPFNLNFSYMQLCVVGLRFNFSSSELISLRRALIYRHYFHFEMEEAMGVQRHLRVRRCVMNGGMETNERKEQRRR